MSRHMKIFLVFLLVGIFAFLGLFRRDLIYLPFAFTGKIESVNNGCSSDGVCFVIVDGRTVITNIGWNREPTGSINIAGVNPSGSLDKAVGKKVRVFAKKFFTTGDYTLIGSERYYINSVE